AAHLGHLLDALAEDAGQWLSHLPLTDDAERDGLILPQTGRAMSSPDTLVSLFERQVGRAPGAVAMTADDATLTYPALGAGADRLACAVAACGVGPGSVVALALPRSAALVTALLAVLKAGAAYLPLDPTYPQDRLTAMLDDAGPVLLLTDRSTAGRL